MELKLIDSNGKVAKKGVAVSDVTFGREFNEALVHQVVVAYMANARTATRAQKGRDTVAHTTHKPYAQKGTGNARAGMTSSPIWRGGGRAFPNSPNERIVVVDDFKIDTPKTKQFVEKIKGLGYADGVLILTDGFDENLYLSSRNLTNVMVVEAQYADPVSLVRFPKVLATAGAVKKLEEMLA